MLDHVGRTPEALTELNEIIRRCTLVETDNSEALSRDGLPASPASSDLETDSDRSRSQTPCSPESESHGVFDDSASTTPPNEPVDPTRLSFSLQQRVDLLMNATLTALDWVPKLPREGQLDSVKFTSSTFTALAHQSLENLHEHHSRRISEESQRRKCRVLSKRLSHAKPTKGHAGDGTHGETDSFEASGVREEFLEESGYDSSESEDERIRQNMAQDDERSGRMSFAGSLVSLGRKLLSLQRNCDMHEGEKQTLDLLIQFSNLKFGEASPQHLAFLLEKSELESAEGNVEIALAIAQHVLEALKDRRLFLTPRLPSVYEFPLVET
ncbi:UNVERIFIED_CONTAM: hypothetical protein HHA_281555 [Hammondia hammondi]|eukprot:XP_008887611.1 hypothetical protein HHA_281555 [Hammondia hammondi]